MLGSCGGEDWNPGLVHPCLMAFTGVPKAPDLFKASLVERAKAFPAADPTASMPTLLKVARTKADLNVIARVSMKQQRIQMSAAAQALQVLPAEHRKVSVPVEQLDQDSVSSINPALTHLCIHIDIVCSKVCTRQLTGVRIHCYLVWRPSTLSEKLVAHKAFVISRQMLSSRVSQ